MKKIITILTVLTVLAICSCNRQEEQNYVSTMAMEEMPFQTNGQEFDKIEMVNRKIIKNGNIRFKTADINKTKSLVLLTVQELNGYISKDNIYDYSDYLEHQLTIRVPAEKFDLLLKNISESVQKLDSKNVDVLDVTAEYIDIDARIKTKKELQNKYIELLKRATNVEEILSIEKEIGNLQTEIETVEGRMRYLKDKIAFSTLTVTYYQETTSQFGFSSKFVEGIKTGWSVFLWFIIGLSHLWVFLFVAVLTIYIIRRYRKNSRKSV